MAKRKTRTRKNRRRSRGLGGISPALRPTARALKMTKGRTCDRKRILKAVGRGTDPRTAVERYCKD